MTSIQPFSATSRKRIKTKQTLYNESDGDGQIGPTVHTTLEGDISVDFGAQTFQWNSVPDVINKF